MIFLRSFNINDKNRLYEIKSNPLNFNRKFTNFDITNVTIESIESFILNIINETNAIRLAICIKPNNILIGCITIGEISYIKSCCEIHIYIDIDYQGKGYGKSSLECLIEYVHNILKLKTMKLKVHKGHVKAFSLYKKLGFVNTNTINNEFVDMHLEIQ